MERIRGEYSKIFLGPKWTLLYSLFKKRNRSEVRFMAYLISVSGAESDLNIKKVFLLIEFCDFQQTGLREKNFEI